MKTTREKLIRLCETYIQQRVVKDRTILCVFLTGSILKEHPFINGTTDVDMIMIHNDLPGFSREVVPVNEEASLDIYHYPKEYFSNTRNLRFDPWLGSALCFDPIVLYGKGHWFEFILSSTEASFFIPEVTLKRVKYFNSQAHKSFMTLKGINNPALINTSVDLYLKSISCAINAVACLNSKPLSTRRTFQDIYEITEGIENRMVPEKAEALITGQQDLSPYFDYFSKSWTYYMEYVSQYAAPNFLSEYSSCRLPYYAEAVNGFWESHRPSSVWIMLNTWCEINKAMKMENSEPYNAFINMLNLGFQNRKDRISQLDQFLETVDDILDDWSSSKGIGEAAELYTDL